MNASNVNHQLFKLHLKILSSILFSDDLNEILIQIRKLVNPFHKEVKPFKFNDLFSFETPKIYNLCMYLNDVKSKNKRNKVKNMYITVFGLFIYKLNYFNF